MTKTWKFEIWKDEHSFCMSPADSPNYMDGNNVRLLHTFEFECSSSKCNDVDDACWECHCQAVQSYNDFLGFGRYNKPDEW